jgi:hypothetical protein
MESCNTHPKGLTKGSSGTHQTRQEGGNKGESQLPVEIAMKGIRTMEMGKKIPNSKKTVEALRHDEATRKNIPTAEYQSVMQKNEQDPVRNLEMADPETPE